MNAAGMTVHELRTIAQLLQVADRLGATEALAEAVQHELHRSGHDAQDDAATRQSQPGSCHCETRLEQALQLVRSQLTGDISRLEAIIAADLRARSRMRLQLRVLLATAMAAGAVWAAMEWLETGNFAAMIAA